MLVGRAVGDDLNPNIDLYSDRRSDQRGGLGPASRVDLGVAPVDVASSSVSPDAPPPLGSTQTMTVAEFSLDVTAYELKNVPPGEFSLLSPGEQMTGLDLQVCSSHASTVQADDRWVLVDTTNGRYEPEVAMDSLTPEYPYYATDIAAGECVRGWIMFKTLADKPISTVRYSTSSGYLLRWTATAV